MASRSLCDGVRVDAEVIVEGEYSTTNYRRRREAAIEADAM
jgi:hypothetical protein